MVAVGLSSNAATAAGDGFRAVRGWLLFLIALVFAMVLVGGATRLTESGLSITEWNLVSGAVPPLSAEAWDAAFALYRQSPQYDLLNQGMSLQDFKTIYWWEWAHRELGPLHRPRLHRRLSLVCDPPVQCRRGLSRSSLAIGILLGAQGVVGWIMVASGLNPGMTAVEPVRLALHLTLASLFLCLAGGALREARRRGTGGRRLARGTDSRPRPRGARIPPDRARRAGRRT